MDQIHFTGSGQPEWMVLVSENETKVDNPTQSSDDTEIDNLCDLGTTVTPSESFVEQSDKPNFTKEDREAAQYLSDLCQEPGPSSKPQICDCGQEFSCTEKLEIHRYENHSSEDRSNRDEVSLKGDEHLVEDYSMEQGRKDSERAGSEDGEQLSDPEVADDTVLTEKDKKDIEYKKRIYKRYKCDHCDLRFNYNSHKRLHMHIHTGEKPYLCDHCGRSFAQQTTLIRHRRTHTGERPYLCSECGKTFAHGNALTFHKRTHSGERPYVCEVCEKGFTQLTGLKNHRMTHSGQKPFSCETCKKSFSTRCALKKHNYTHTGEKPHVCDTCRKGFAQLGALQVHKRTHTGEKPYQCCWCQRRFTDNCTLTKHIRTHTGERPYVCDVCNKAFAQPTPLKAHKRIHENSVQQHTLHDNTHASVMNV